MATQNVELLQERGVKKIITQCPHCFTTLKNDYRQYGLELEVVHHSQLLADLLASGKLKVRRGPSMQAARSSSMIPATSAGTTTIYAAPRQVLAAATGRRPGEFARHGENAFCCGAGGGRMWMEEHSGTRINLERVRRGARPGARDDLRLLPLLHDDVRGRSERRPGLKRQGERHRRGARRDLRAEADLSRTARGFRAARGRNLLQRP